MRRRVLYHDHMVAMARARLGDARADLLLHDCGHRGQAHRDALADETGWLIRPREEGRDTVLYAVDEAIGWVGAELQLDKHLPEAVQTAVVGRRLGDLIAGTGADDHVVVASGLRQQGTRLVVATRLIDARDVPVSFATRTLGIARRLARSSRREWVKQFIEYRRDDVAKASDLLHPLAILAILLVGSVASTGLMLLFGAPGAVGTILMDAPYAWFCSGLVVESWLIVKRLRRAGTATA